MKLEFTIPGKPQPKQRARRGKGGRWYTPKETRAYERTVKMCGLAERPCGWPRDAAYRLTLGVYMPDRRTRDLDNITKAVSDALNVVLWNDDRQVVELRVTKALDRERPRVDVEVEVVQP